jgi:hypothetical protein
VRFYAINGAGQTKVTAQHYQFESELLASIAEIDGFRDQILHEIADIRDVIQVYKLTKEEIRHASEFTRRTNAELDAFHVSFELKAIRPR